MADQVPSDFFAGAGGGHHSSKHTAKGKGKEHLRYIVACAGHKAAQHRAKQAALCRESYDRGTQDRTWDDTDPTVT